MTFKKLALASAIALVPMATYAVETLDDAALSETTGQDGIELVVNTLNLATDTLIHDTDGFVDGAGSTYTSAGAIFIDDMSIVSSNVTIAIDAGDNNATTSATAPALNVNVNLANGITITTGAIRVANSNRDDGSWGYTGATATIVNSATLTLGATQLDVQLGNEPQGDMISFNANITGGITMSGVGLTDVNSGGTIGSSTMTLVDSVGGTDLAVDIDINVTIAGLVVDINTLGNGGMDVRIVDQYLGTTTAGIIGDIEMQGLNLAGTQVTISGK